MHPGHVTLHPRHDSGVTERVLFIVTSSPRSSWDAASFRNNRRARGTKTEIFATITRTIREKGPSFYVNNHSQKEKYSERRVATRSHWSLLTVLKTRCRHPLSGPGSPQPFLALSWLKQPGRMRGCILRVMRIMTNLLREQWPGSRALLWERWRVLWWSMSTAWPSNELCDQTKLLKQRTNASLFQERFSNINV